MTVSEQIECLFDSGVQGISIGKPPSGPNNPTFFMKAEQGFQTPGGTGNTLIVGHQVAADTFGECLRRLSAQVDAAYKLKGEKSSGIVVPKGNV